MVVGTEKFQKLFVNSYYEADFEFAIHLNRKLLKPIGMWNFNFKCSKEKYITYFLRIGCIVVLLFLIVPGCIDIILTRDLQAVFIKAGPLSFTIMNMLYYCFFLIHQKEIHMCLELMCNDWRSVSKHNREIMLKNANTARNFIIFRSIFSFTGSVSFTIFFPLSDNYFSSVNETVLNIAFPGNFLLFDVHKRPFYDIIFCLQILGAFTCCSVISGICSVVISFVMHISGQLEILNGFLQLFVKDKDKMISFIVEHHLKSLRFAERLENIMNEICLIEFLNSSVGICLIGYYISWEFKNKDITKMIVYCILLMSYIFNIFIYCFLSELLLTKCEEVGKQTYMIQWNYLPKRKQLDLIPIILISSKPAKLTAGKIVSFSIGCFCNVLKVSTAYLNFIRSFMD